MPALYPLPWASAAAVAAGLGALDVLTGGLPLGIQIMAAQPTQQGAPAAAPHQRVLGQSPAGPARSQVSPPQGSIAAMS